MKKVLIFLIFFPQGVWAGTIFEPNMSLQYGGFAGDIQGSDLLTDGTPVNISYTSLSAGFRYGITRDYVHVTAVVDGYAFMSSNDVNVESAIQFVPNVGIGIGYEWNIPLRTYVVIGFPFSSLEVSYYLTEKYLLGFKATRMEMEFAGADLEFNSFGLSFSMPIEFEYPSHWWRKRDWE